MNSAHNEEKEKCPIAKVGLNCNPPYFEIGSHKYAPIYHE